MTETEEQKNISEQPRPESGRAQSETDSVVTNENNESVDAQEQNAEEASPTVSKPKTNSHDQARESKMTGDQKSSRAGFYFLLLLLLLIALTAIAAYGAYWFWGQYSAGEQTWQASIEQLNQQLKNQQNALTAIENSQDRTLNSVREQLDQTQQRLQAAEQSLAAQNKRLLSMSTTSREDWLLAEAEYLLKLANQRVLIERSAEDADALLSEADAILRDLADPDLFPLRQAIANDLAELRLVKEVDVEGIYLALEALASRVDDLPVRPTRKQIMGEDTIENASPEVEPGETEQGWWEELKDNISRFTGDADRYIRLRDHAEKPRPMLPPDSEQYLQQNLRLILQRAQLALMREQQKIYNDSLQQARQWVARYYPPSEEAQKFQRQIDELQSREIVRQLPDITESLELVHAYIDRLHRLDGAEPAEDTSGEQQ